MCWTCRRDGGGGGERDRRKRGIGASCKINTTKTYSERFPILDASARFPILDPSVRFPIFNSLCPISDFGY